MIEVDIRKIAGAVIGVATGSKPYLHTANLSTTIDLCGNPMQLRDVIRLIFAELGIDIEFSGKNEHEKSVIIDIDEEKIVQLHLNHDILRFGQTVVRATAPDLTAYSFGPDTKQWAANECYSADEIIKNTVHAVLNL